MVDGESTLQRAGEEQILRILSRVRSAGVSDPYPGKRGQTRFANDFALEVTANVRKPSAVLIAHLHNISDGGCAFWARKKLRPRSEVYLREPASSGDHPWIRARVTHCTVGIRGFLVGVTFDPA